MNIVLIWYRRYAKLCTSIFTSPNIDKFKRFLIHVISFCVEFNLITDKFKRFFFFFFFFFFSSKILNVFQHFIICKRSSMPLPIQIVFGHHCVFATQSLPFFLNKSKSILNWDRRWGSLHCQIWSLHCLTWWQNTCQVSKHKANKKYL